MRGSETTRSIVSGNEPEASEQGAAVRLAAAEALGAAACLVILISGRRRRVLPLRSIGGAK
jgi:hypothetical protein